MLRPIDVLIFRGDSFPCGSRLWVQTTTTFANHVAKARTLRYTWTLNLALCKKSDGDVLGALLHGTLRTYYVRARVIIGGDTPWPRHLLDLSTYFGVGSVYLFATWCRELQKWCDTDVPRTTKAEKNCGVCTLVVQLRVYNHCVAARGCMKKPLLHLDDRYHFVVTDLSRNVGGKIIQIPPHHNGAMCLSWR